MKKALDIMNEKYSHTFADSALIEAIVSDATIPDILIENQKLFSNNAVTLDEGEFNGCTSLM